MPDINRGVRAGALGGAVWGLAIFTLALIFGVSEIERSLLNELLSFMVGGMVFGVITGCMFSVTRERIPVTSSVIKGVIVSVAVWVILLCGAVGLSFLSPERYNIHFIEMARGLILVAVLGGIIGVLGGRRA